MRPGSRFYSAVCETEVVIVRAADVVELSCGGVPMADAAPAVRSSGPARGHDTGTVLGKRYEDGEAGIEVLCVKGGRGSVAVEGRLLSLKSAKPLPASD
ncbi:hypothetical protein [Pseudonocardia xishanensis]|uniref:Uncharacterized protein n=1 Tax=Pseudonocardia xishanensis TaxID=630995 RepID=A0ABP8RUZ9_9PSEU